MNLAKPVAALLLALLLPGCKKPEPAPPSQKPPDSLRQLDQLSVEQRRVFLRGFAGDWRGDTDMGRGLPEPPASLPVPEDARTVDLPDPETLELGKLPVSEAIARRRSRREFTEAALTLEQFTYLLVHTQGITGEQKTDAGELTHQFRAAPSGGGRYPLETFLAVQRVDGLTPGLYRYLPERHRLLVVAEDPGIGEKLQQACYNNATIGDSAAVFIWAAVPYRSEWKYGCIAHKMVALEAGHVCQNLYLATESIGAGTCAMLGYHQPLLDELIGADGEEVFTIYLAAVGKLLHP